MGAAFNELRAHEDAGRVAPGRAPRGVAPRVGRVLRARVSGRERRRRPPPRVPARPRHATLIALLSAEHRSVRLKPLWTSHRLQVGTSLAASRLHLRWVDEASRMIDPVAQSGSRRPIRRPQRDAVTCGDSYELGILAAQDGYRQSLSPCAYDPQSSALTKLRHSPLLLQHSKAYCLIQETTRTNICLRSPSRRRPLRRPQHTELARRAAAANA